MFPIVKKAHFIIQKLFRDYLEIKTFEKFKFEKKVESILSAG